MELMDGKKSSIYKNFWQKCVNAYLILLYLMIDSGIIGLNNIDIYLSRIISLYLNKVREK